MTTHRNAFSALRVEEAEEVAVPLPGGPAAKEGTSWQREVCWSCTVCTFADNWATEEACSLCQSLRTDGELLCAAAVAVVWRCGSCTLDNDAAVRLCEACGTPKVNSSRTTGHPPPSATVWGERVLPSWNCACGTENQTCLDTCTVCGEAKPLLTTPSRCPACSPRRACPAHVHLRLRAAAEVVEARELRRTEAWLRWEEAGLCPLYRDPELEAALLQHVDSRTRAATLAVREHAQSEPPDASTFRDMYSRSIARPFSHDQEGREHPVCVFDTDWEQGREPRRRVQLLHAAGWRRVTRGAHGGVGAHYKWRRELGGGCGAQVVTFSSTPSSVRSYNHEKAALSRLDKEAADITAAAAARREL